MADAKGIEDDRVLADGVDEEAVEPNRRLFTGRTLIMVSALATLYAAFHMAALNGLSIRDWTGVAIPFLPQFPMETWNFRIVHIAGALALGFLLFSGRAFDGHGQQGRPLVGHLAL
ncbi:MAG: TRAP transporter permease, partial [Pseudomonadota bacterium]